MNSVTAGRPSSEDDFIKLVQYCSILYSAGFGIRVFLHGGGVYMTMTGRNGKKQGILYVERNADSREIVTVLLADSGFAVATSDTMSEGSGLARIGWFDLILLGLTYRDGTGIELCQEIRSYDRYTPILFFSSLVSKSDVDAGIAAGANGYITKPIGIETLAQTVSNVLASAYRHTGDARTRAQVGSRSEQDTETHRDFAEASQAEAS